MNAPLRHGSGGPKGPTIQSITLRTDDTVEVNLAISRGPIVGLARGTKSLYLNGTALQSPNGSNNFNPFEVHLYHGSDTASPVINALGGTTSNTSVGVALAELTPVIRTTPPALRSQIDVLELRFFINQLVKTDSSGSQLYNTLLLDVEFREAGTTQWLPFFQSGTTISINGRISGAVKEFSRQVPRVANDWEIRVTKQNPDNDPNLIAAVTWESFQATTTGPRTYNNLALIRALSSVTEQMNGIPQVSGVYHGQIFKIPSNYDPVARYYNGVWDGTFKDGYTDNPVWALYYLLTDTEIGAKAYYPNLQVDRFSFYQAAQWCDQLVPRPGGGYQPRYTYNDLFAEARSGQEAIAYIASIFGGRLIEDAGGTLVLKVDRPGTPKQIFGLESISVERLNYQYTDVESRPNEARVSFVNPDLNWEDDLRLVELPTYQTRNGRNSQDFVAVGCIDVYEAQRRAFMMLLRANTEVTTVTFRTARQALLLEPFDIIGISDPDMQWGLSGRIKSVSGSDIFLRDSLLLPINTDITMSVQSPSGVTTLTVRTTVANTKKLTITAGVLPVDLPDRAQFTLEETSIGLVKPFRILTIEEDDEKPDFAQVTALEINTNKWDDADNLVSSGTIPYNSAPLVPGLIQNIQVESGTSHLLKHTDGTIESRIFVSWTVSPPAPVDIRYRRLNSTQFEVIKSTGSQGYIPNVVDGADYVLELISYASDGTQAYRSPPIVHNVVGKTAAPSVPLGWVLVSGFNAITLKGASHPDADFSHFNIYGATLNDPTPIPLVSISATQWTRQIPLSDTITRYQITAVDTTGHESAPTAFIDGLPDDASVVDIFANAGLTVPAVVSALPASGGPPDLVFLTTDSKLYRWDGTGWVATVNTTDLVGVLDVANFATTLRPPEVLAALPGTGDGNYVGRMVFLTTDGKLYRNTTGADDTSGWTAVVAGSDIESNSITAGQIAAGAIGATEIAAGAITANKLAVTDLSKVFSCDFIDATSLVDDWEVISGTGELSIVSNAAYSGATRGGFMLQAGNNAVDDQVWLAHKRLIPFDKDAMYKWSVRARNVSGAGTFYCGFIGYAEDGVTPVFYDGTAVEAGHYHCLSNYALTTAFQTYEGYTKGYGATVGTFGTGAYTTPGQVHPNVRYIRPFLICNYNAGSVANITYVDFFDCQKLSGATLIEPGGVTTANINAGTINADRLMAGTITGGLLAAAGIITDTAQIADAVITSAKIANTIQSTNFSAGAAGWQIQKSGNAEFNSLVVREDMLASQSTAIGTSALTVAATTITSTAATDVQTVTLTTTGGKVLLIGTADYGGVYDPFLSIYRNGTLLAQVTTDPAALVDSTMSGSPRLQLFDAPAAGTHTYHLKMAKQSAGDANFTVENRSLVAIEYKQA